MVMSIQVSLKVKKGEKTEKVLSASHIFSSTHAWPVWVVEELLHQKPVQPPLCCLQPAKPTPSHDETDIGFSSCFLKTHNDGNDNNLFPQDIYGMHVTQCLVRDGLGWSEQGLINEEGCPQVITISISASSSRASSSSLPSFFTILTTVNIRITRSWAS